MFEYHFEVEDVSSGYGPQKLRIDIAPPEIYSARSISDLKIGATTVRALSLERMTGEKLRAFLSCLPSYRRKINNPQPPVIRRAKDLYDLAKIAAVHSLASKDFWLDAAVEFRLACESRCISCQGIETFREDWLGTETAFRDDRTLPNDLDFKQVSEVLHWVVEFLKDSQFLPFDYPLPPLA